MYGALQQKKLTQQDMILSCEQAKYEMKYDIDYDHKRSNVDSAKKRAVLQHMDYDGFHQMVLGANLFTIKSKELNNFSTGKANNYDSILNSSVQTFNNVVDLDYIKNPEIQKFNMMIAEQLSNSEMNCKNFRDFKKNFDKFYKQPIDEIISQTIFMYLKAQTYDNLPKVYNLEFDVQYFIKILNVFEFILQNAIFPNKNQLEYDFVIAYLEQLTKIKDFKFSVPQFLSKKEKQYLNEFIEMLSNQDNLVKNELKLDLNQFEAIQQFFKTK